MLGLFANRGTNHARGGALLLVDVFCPGWPSENARRRWFQFDDVAVRGGFQPVSVKGHNAAVEINHGERTISADLKSGKFAACDSWPVRIVVCSGHMSMAC